MLLLLLLLNHILRCDHLATALTAQHLFELWLVLTISHGIAASSKVYSATVGEIALALIICGYGA